MAVQFGVGHSPGATTGVGGDVGRPFARPGRAVTAVAGKRIDKASIVGAAGQATFEFTPRDVGIAETHPGTLGEHLFALQGA